jgi:serine/threonine-protein kinase RsbT
MELIRRPVATLAEQRSSEDRHTRHTRWRPSAAIPQMSTDELATCVQGADARARVRVDSDIVVARQLGRAMAVAAGFASPDPTLIATAISELARNIVLYAKSGEIVLKIVEHGSRLGLQIVARDDGPGIPDIGRAMQFGYSTSGGLGLGLPGVQRIMDEFDIVSQPGKGTRVTILKWRP